MLIFPGGHAQRSTADARLAAFSYRTYGPESYAQVFEHCHEEMENNAVWVLSDFGKPGCESAQPAPREEVFIPYAESLSLQHDDDHDHAIVRLRFVPGACEVQGAPRQLELTYSFSKDKSKI